MKTSDIHCLNVVMDPEWVEHVARILKCRFCVMTARNEHTNGYTHNAYIYIYIYIYIYMECRVRWLDGRSSILH